MSTTDTSSISFTAYYTGQTWLENGLSADFFSTREGRLLFNALRPVEFFGERLLGTNIRTTLLQRHAIEDECIERAIIDEGYSQIIELACGLSPRGYRFMQGFPEKNLRYIETDLPGMAKRKRHLLAGHIPAHADHRVVVCNILEQNSPDSLESVFARELDPTRKTLVITEGLVNYFSLDAMTALWQRLAQLLKGFPEGRYITEEYLQVQAGRWQPLVAGYSETLKRLSRSSVSLHFHPNEDIAAHFSRCGFNAGVQVHDPDHYRGAAVYPRSRRAALVRVIEATVRSGG